jgi:hypothetical protein
VRKTAPDIPRGGQDHRRGRISGNGVYELRPIEWLRLPLELLCCIERETRPDLRQEWVVGYAMMLGLPDIVNHALTEPALRVGGGEPCITSPEHGWAGRRKTRVLRLPCAAAGQELSRLRSLNPLHSIYLYISSRAERPLQSQSCKRPCILSCIASAVIKGSSSSRVAFGSSKLS